MKNIALILLLVFALAACKQSPKNTENNTAQTTIEAVSPTDVIVYYFHGKQRCKKTCVAVGDVAKETVEKSFADNKNVRFVEISTSEKGNDALIEKYDVTWNALIIAKGEDFVEITDQAFATAVKNPQSLENLIKEEVNKLLK
jgi:PBP1b-binding outer membrane lipoprotein LpoB